MLLTKLKSHAAYKRNRTGLRISNKQEIYDRVEMLTRTACLSASWKAVVGTEQEREKERDL
jgi:hypothetical protein